MPKCADGGQSSLLNLVGRTKVDGLIHDLGLFLRYDLMILFWEVLYGISARDALKLSIEKKLVVFFFGRKGRNAARRSKESLLEFHGRKE